ncbi:single-stranded-DNA-specific exonuclease RecJ [Parvularcula sp. LCG005]|uniref:single-stranded-DNA-specific exonuclease RecJ n=1 Tax=Parvularcula sp. LCG005 TaxID=3078805 RepID=UPI00294221A6|nr:single-stranded-DNA-specific exonuclease RecJ [Parvularcula sp. LCG005]WOI52450.1 single-stranded-DNA-specific exonuclease RecJ [Parvularcula sp. LCG005]
MQNTSPIDNPVQDTDAFLNVTSSVSGKKWQRRKVDARAAETIVQREGCHPILADILVSRGVTADSFHSFTQPSLRDALPDPSVLKDMDVAAQRLADAIAGGETIGIFGDYDVDGTVSSALMSRYLTALDVPHAVHLPDRMTEGYGPNLPAFDGLAEKGAKLIVTVDCGATAGAVLSAAKVKGYEIVVLDHHLMETVPDALAIVNPQRPDDLSGLTELSAGGVVFMTLVATNRALRKAGHFKDRKEPNLLQWLDLVALSLVCDVMPLKGLTRTLVAQGLKLLQDFDTCQVGNPGLRALAAMAGAKGRAQAHHFGFAVGPRINAAGRIGHARLAYELLSSDDPATVETLAHRLQSLNGARQDVEAAVLDAAIEQAEARGGRDVAAPLVVAEEGWHAGVIGIVAGRLKERFDRPTIVIAFEGDEGKGSGRSLPGVDLGEAIQQAVKAGIIAGGGGHPMAAGVSLTRAQLPGFEAYLAETLSAAVGTSRAERAFLLDGLIGVGSITRDFCDMVELAGPFGNAAPEPRFALEGVRLRHLKVLKDKHIALTVEDGMGRTARAITFGCIGQPLGDFLQAAADGRQVHLAGRIKPDDWRGGNAGQFHIEDAAIF